MLEASETVGRLDAEGVLGGLLSLAERVARLPREPGVYQWKDAEGTILYVGKAEDLRHSGGFGSRLCSMMAGQLGGTFERRMEGGNLKAQLAFPVIALLETDARAA